MSAFNGSGASAVLSPREKHGLLVVTEQDLHKPNGNDEHEAFITVHVFAFLFFDECNDCFFILLSYQLFLRVKNRCSHRPDIERCPGIRVGTRCLARLKDMLASGAENRTDGHSRRSDTVTLGTLQTKKNHDVSLVKGCTGWGEAGGWASQ